MAMPKETFSKRLGMRPDPQRAGPNEIPDAVRVKLIPLIDEYRGNGLTGATTLGVNLYEAIGKISPQSTGDMKMIRSLFLEAEWWQVYDLCETLVKLCRFREQIAERIDAIFAEEGAPYRMTASGIVWRFTEAAAEALTETTRCLVDEPSLRGPSGQWQKALEHLSQRPPDAENCIKDAIGAVEGAARILSGRETDTLSALIKPFAKEIKMHPALAGVVEKLYAYRGDEQAVAHGATQEAKDLIAEAELVLQVSAAVIVYFVKKT
jgi:hypothetical protein